MGRMIDKIALNALIAFIYYLFFMAAFSSIPAACALTFLSCALTHRLLSGLKGRRQGSRRFRKRALRARIAAMLDDLSLSPDPQPQLLPILQRLFPEICENGAEIVILPRPAACAPLSAETCFDVWRKNRDAGRLLIVCTGRADVKAFALTQTLSAPPVRILDRERLGAALEKHPGLVPETPSAEPAPRRKRLRRLPVERKSAPRCLLSGLMLLAMYLILGNALYLVVSLALLTLAALALRKPRIPEKLF